MQTSLMSDAAKSRPSSRLWKHNFLLHDERNWCPWYFLCCAFLVFNKHPVNIVAEGPQKPPQRRRAWVSWVNTTVTLSHKYIYTSLHINIDTLKLGLPRHGPDTHARLKWYAIYSLTNISVVNVMQSNFYFIDIFTLSFVILKCF